MVSLIEFPESINICSIHGFGNERISLTRLAICLLDRALLEVVPMVLLDRHF